MWVTPNESAQSARWHERKDNVLGAKRMRVNGQMIRCPRSHGKTQRKESIDMMEDEIGVWLLRCQTEKAIKPNAPNWENVYSVSKHSKRFPLDTEALEARSPTTAYHCPKTPSQFRALVAVLGLTRSNQTPISSSIMSIEVNWLLPLCLFLSSHEISGIWYLKFISPTDGILVSGPPKTNQNGILSLTKPPDQFVI